MAAARTTPQSGSDSERRDPHAMRDGRQGQDPPSPEALDGDAAAQRAGGVRHGVDQVVDPETGIGLAEVTLDRANQGRDQQPRPADQQERETGDDTAGARVREGRGTREC